MSLRAETAPAHKFPPLETRAGTNVPTCISHFVLRQRKSAPPSFHSMGEAAPHESGRGGDGSCTQRRRKEKRNSPCANTFRNNPFFPRPLLLPQGQRGRDSQSFLFPSSLHPISFTKSISTPPPFSFPPKRQNRIPLSPSVFPFTSSLSVYEAAAMYYCRHVYVQERVVLFAGAVR